MLFVGDGWGKSAAAFGYANRSVGRGWKTLVIQFIKGGAWNPAEGEMGRRLGIEWPIFTPSLTWAQAGPAQLGTKAWATARAAFDRGEHGLIVLDEITHAIDSGWVDEREVIRAIENRAATTSVIITGRQASRRVRAVADTITKFERVKHDEKRGILG